MLLSDRAGKIIGQVSHTDDNIVELQKIAREMSLLYGKTHTLGLEAEENYNVTRSNEYVNLMEEKMTQGDRERKAKDIAEIKYGNYRTVKAKADAIKASIKSIEGFCIAYYFKSKQERSASMTQE